MVAQQLAGADGKGASPSTSSLSSLSGSSCGAKAGSREQKTGAPSKRIHGTKRPNLSLTTKSEVVDHLKNKELKVAVVAEKFNIAERTMKKIRAEEKNIMEQLDSRPGVGKAKSLKGPKFPEVRVQYLCMVQFLRRCDCAAQFLLLCCWINMWIERFFFSQLVCVP